MKIPSAKYLVNKARLRLENGQDPLRVVLVYAVVVAGTNLLVNAVQLFVSSQMSQAGGLQNISTRSWLGTISQLLPILQTVVRMCIGLGYTAAMLRIARRQYASPKTLKAGAERFWVLLRSRILVGLMYLAAGFVLSYVAIGIFMATPLSNQFNAALVPIVRDSSLSLEALLESDAVLATLTDAMVPMLLLYSVLLIPVSLIINYVYRFADHILIDQPGCGALSALRQSRAKTRGNLGNLFRLDLHFWWYFLLRGASVVVLYLDVLLSLFGIYLPGPAIVAAYAPLLLYLAADAAITILFQNRIAVAVALAYDALTPKERQEGVVLGNIFQTE